MTDSNAVSAQAEATDSLADDLIWGAAAIAKEIGRDTRPTFHLLETRKIPAEKIGGLWVASRQKLRRRLVDGEGA